MQVPTPLSEQVTSGGTVPDEQDGKIRNGGPKPKPLQGGADAAQESHDADSGSEGDGP